MWKILSVSILREDDIWEDLGLNLAFICSLSSTNSLKLRTIIALAEWDVSGSGKTKLAQSTFQLVDLF